MNCLKLLSLTLPAVGYRAITRGDEPGQHWVEFQESSWEFMAQKKVCDTLLMPLLHLQVYLWVWSVKDCSISEAEVLRFLV